MITSRKHVNESHLELKAPHIFTLVSVSSGYTSSFVNTRGFSTVSVSPGCTYLSSVASSTLCPWESALRPMSSSGTTFSPRFWSHSRSLAWYQETKPEHFSSNRCGRDSVISVPAQKHYSWFLPFFVFYFWLVLMAHIRWVSIMCTIYGYDYTVRFIAPILLYWCHVIVRIWKRYESTRLNRIVANKSDRVIVAYLEPGWGLNNYLGKLYCVSIL